MGLACSSCLTRDLRPIEDLPTQAACASATATHGEASSSYDACPSASVDPLNKSDATAQDVASRITDGPQTLTGEEIAASQASVLAPTYGRRAELAGIGGVRRAVGGTVTRFQCPAAMREPMPPSADLPKALLSATSQGALGAVGSSCVLLSGAEDKMLRAWEVSGQESAIGMKPLQVMEGHEDWILEVVVSSDGRRAATASSDKSLRIWDLEAWCCIGVLKGHDAGVHSVAVNFEGQQVISGSADKTIRLWDLDQMTSIRTLTGHTGTIWGLAADFGQQRLVSGSHDGTLRLWDIATADCVHILQGHTAGVLTVAVHFPMRRALSGSADRSLMLWDLENGECLGSFDGHGSLVWSVSADFARGIAASGSLDGTVRLWDLTKMTCTGVLAGHGGGVLSSVADFSRGIAVASTRDGSIHVWDLHTLARVRLEEVRCGGIWTLALVSTVAAVE